MGPWALFLAALPPQTHSMGTLRAAVGSAKFVAEANNFIFICGAALPTPFPKLKIDPELHLPAPGTWYSPVSSTRHLECTQVNQQAQVCTGKMDYG